MEQIAAGIRIGEHVLDQHLGDGAFSTVWRAHHHYWVDDADKVVAVKIPKPEYANTLFKDALVHELQHPNILRMVGFDPYGQVPYLMMEYVPGTNLRTLISQKQLSPEQAAMIMRQVLAGLGEAHQHGLVHRDIKPENILIHHDAQMRGFDSPGVVKLADFGVGHAVQAIRGSIMISNVTVDGAIVGTIDYMSPEQKRGGVIDHRADLYACAVVLYEMITGGMPDSMELPSDINHSSAKYLDDAFKKGYARLDSRFQTASEFADALTVHSANRAPTINGKTQRMMAMYKGFNVAESSPTPGQLRVARAESAVDGEPAVRFTVNFAPQTPTKSPGFVGKIFAVKPSLTLPMEMALIPAATYWMGSPVAEKDARDNEYQHRVIITSPYYIALHHVTRGQFAVFVEATQFITDAERLGTGHKWNGTTWINTKGASWRDPGFYQQDNHPVVMVSHNDALAFCEWLKKTENHNFRLPTEAEWELACRNDENDTFPFNTGRDIGIHQANFNYDASQKGSNKAYPRGTTPVGKYPDNGRGLFDMHGNAWQWCSDWYVQHLTETVDPQGPETGTHRVLRGGSWLYVANHCRTACRSFVEATYWSSAIGFRVAADAAK